MPGAYNSAVFPSERFFREAWPTISQDFESADDPEAAVAWIVANVKLPDRGRVLDAPCGFGRHSVAFARRGYRVTGVDFSETELDRARSAVAAARVHGAFLCQDMRDMEFSGEFDLAVNLFSSIGYFSDDEDRLLLDRFWRALAPGGTFVLDTRNRDHFVRHVTAEEVVAGLRIENTFDPETSRVRGVWHRVDDGQRLGETEFRLYAAHELRAMLRPERWRRVDLHGGLDGSPFTLDAPRLVLIATK
ncbi:MAG: SAM-dependent methyltransferase [Candidatus Rokuibacteriota bacterium]|nr:MAG: SAM-dependent methyltransferase [Candidatus Rokubacteria bacterium]